MEDGKRKKRGQSGDDDQIPLRQRMREFVEGQLVTAIMTITTLFALFGDDIRLWLFDKDTDIWFSIGLIVSLFLFAIELLL